MMLSLCLVLSLMFGSLVSAADQPNIVFIMADDYGWANVGFHREVATPDVVTPNIDGLVAAGIELDRHYVYQFCSPSRSAFLSGRNPIHVNVLNLDNNYNPNDPLAGYAGVPLNMTMIAEKLHSVGYTTHYVGKWDAGFATWEHLPISRGFDTSFGYFHHANDYWKETDGECSNQTIIDLWNTNHTASHLSNKKACSQKNQAADCVYEDNLFLQEVLNVISNKPADQPLFLYWAPHTVHEPLEVPTEYLTKFSFIDDEARQYYSAMVNHLDDMVGTVVAALKTAGLYNNTLIAFSSDNGGPIYNNGTAGANNYPLRGGKMSNWEGGIRSNAFASGGFIPESQQGTIEENYVTLWDWYATFCAVAGVSPIDEVAAASGLPPVDSINLWPLLSGQNKTGPRTEVPIGGFFPDQATVVQGLISGPYKLLLYNLTQNGWTGPTFPNTSTNWNSGDSVEHCGTAGCLFNIQEDPTEHSEISAQFPAVATQLRTRIAELQKTVFSPDRGANDPAACKAALGKYDGYWGPWLA